MVSHSLIKNLSLTKKNLWWVPMTKAALRAAYSEEFITAERRGKHRLDELDAARVARHLLLFRPDEQVLEAVTAKARLAIPGLAASADVQRTVRFNPDCVFAVARKSKFDPAAPVAEGFIAILPLNDRGLRALALDALTTANPDTKFLAEPGERPAGIYMWGVYAPGPLAAGMALFMDEIATPQYAGVNLYSRPNTDVGRRFNQVLGLTEGVKIGDVDAPHLWIFPRTPQRPLYDSYSPDPAPGEIGITVARSFNDLARVIAVRGAVYIGEQECPYDEEYDGNDLSATHLLGYVGREPAGCVRIRFFAGFAKIERMSIRQEYRKTRVAIQLIRAMIQFCRKKGYTRIYGHSQARLVNFWARFGFKVLEGSKGFVFSDFDYVELLAEVERDPDCVTLGVDPYVLIRPEGRWDIPGILENSASRPVTRPSVNR
jgi:predicted GNAT family N-acyltransferase